MTLVRYESAGHVATITMDRSSAHNALNNALCDELRVIAMSATLDPGPVSQRLGGAPVIESAGTLHTVATSHANIDQGLPLETRVTRAVLEALKLDDSGDLLVFLPGSGEIRACERALEGCDADVPPLDGVAGVVREPLLLDDVGDLAAGGAVDAEAGVQAEQGHAGSPRSVLRLHA